MVELLLHNGALQRTACSDGKTALHYASQAGHARIVQRLVQDADVELVNQRDQAAWTPLHYAAEHGGIDVVCLLLEVSSTLFWHCVAHVLVSVILDLEVEVNDR